MAEIWSDFKKKQNKKTKKISKKKEQKKVAHDICAQNNKAQTHPFSKMTEANEVDEAFKQLIIECGRALNTLELVILNLRFPLLQYFETLSIYKLPKAEKFMVFTLRKALSPADF